MNFEAILPPQLDIYRASAGSGKTFLLTMQYLKLLLQSPTKYREILAVTFTNKATEEMKHRILGELQNLAAGKQTLYGQKLLEAIDGLSATDLQQHASRVYSAILHDYSRFAISTIDSFVQKIVRSFAYEIGLDAGFTLQMNADSVKEDLTLRLYKLLDTNVHLRDWVVEMAGARLTEGKNWDFKADMMELAGELFKERFQQFDVAMNTMDAGQKAQAFADLKTHVFAAVHKFENEMATLGKTAVALVVANELEPADFYYGKAGFINHFYKAANKTFGEAGVRVTAFLENSDIAAPKKAAQHKKDIINGISSQLHNLMTQITCCYTDNLQNYYTAQAIKQNLYTLQLMQVFSNELAHYRSDNNALLISDTHLLLRQLSQENEASFIFEKTGNRYKHFLIDEFQDTSVFQWDNFKPLLENSLAEGQYNLIVGDVKQAIYRWRSGDWRLLLSEVKKQLQSFRPKESTLQENYRSAKPLIAFNNYLFATIPVRLQDKFNADMASAPVDIQQRLEDNGYYHIIENAYSDSFQETPASAPDDGLVSIEFLEDAEDGVGNKISFTGQVLEKLPVVIETLLTEGGYQPKDITILTRGNHEASQVIQALMQHQQQPNALAYTLISADALFIGANEGVQMIIAAMRWLVNDSDTLSKAFLIKTVAERSGSSIPQHQLYISNGKGEALLPPLLLNGRGGLQSLPVIDLVNKLADLFGIHQQQADHACLLAFQDLVLEWNRVGEDGLLAFINYWEIDGKKKSLPAGTGTDAVEVMTIHKSKGLAFEVLILPFCNWALEPDAKKNNWLWVKTEATNFKEIPVVPVKYKKELGQSDFAYEYFEEQLLSQMDSLNMLYVATTRAKRQITAFAPKPKTDKAGDSKIKTVGDLLYHVLETPVENLADRIENVNEAFGENQLLFGGAPTPKAAATVTSTGINLGELVYGDWRQQLQVRPAAMLPGEDKVSLPRTRGTLLHHALSLLQQPAELHIVLQQMEMKGLVNATIKKEMQAILEKLLKNELLAGWTTNTMYRISERDIVTIDRQLKRPDLVLASEEQTLVIDFKFTEGKDPKLNRQVQEYRSLLQEMQFKNVKGYLLYGLRNEVEEVVG
ncbi:MAG: UvrD-helicase domain-containing protein [Chitinophagaceae bacterium]